MPDAGESEPQRIRPAAYSRGRIRLVAAAMALLVLASIGGFLFHERSQSLKTAVALSERRAGVQAVDVGHVMGVAAAAVQRTEARLAQWPPGVPVAGLLAALALEQQPLLAALPLSPRLVVLGADGRARAGDGQAPAEPMALPAADGWQVGLTRGAAGRRSLPVLRRAAPNPHGVAAYMVELDHAALVARLESSRVPPGGGAAVFRLEADGSTSLLARAPLDEAEIGRRLRGPLATRLEKSRQGWFNAPVLLDGVRRTVAYRRLDGELSQLVVAYGMSNDQVLADWQAQLPWAAGVALLLLVGIGSGARRLEKALQVQSDQLQALQGSESQFRALANNLPDVVVRLDRAGAHLFVNPAIEQATGLPPESFVGQTYGGLAMPADRVEQWMACLDRVFSSGQAERLEFEYPGPAGLRYWESRIVREPQLPGAAPTALVISRDITDRRLALQALQLGEQQLNEAQHLAKIGSWEWDLRSGRLSWSAELFRILEIDPDHVVPGPEAFAATVHPDDRAAVEEAYRRSVAERLPYDITHRSLMADGRIKHIHERGRTHYADDGTPIRSVGTAEDITQRLAAEQALHDSEERLRLALEAAQQGLYDLDMQSGDAVVSPEYATMLGHDPATFHETNAAWRERLHPDDRAAAEQVYFDYVAGRRADYRVEFRQRMRDGRWKWILSVGRIQARAADGTPLRMLGTHTDLDAIKAAQAEQVAATRRFETMFQAAPEAMSVSDLVSGRYLQVNDAFCELFGHPRAAVIGHTAVELGLWAQVESRESIVTRLRAGESVQGFEDVGRRESGETIDVMYSAERIELDGRECLLLMFRDITERRAAEARVRQLAAELEQRVQERTAQLARSEARFRTIFETVPISIGEEDWSGVQRLLLDLRRQGVTDGPAYFADHPGFVLDCLRAVKVRRRNHKAQQLHGAHELAHDLPGLRAFYPEAEYLPQFIGELQAMWAAQRLFTAKRSPPAATGRPLSLMLSISLPALDDADGTALVCLVDITEIDRLNAELDRSIARLTQVNRELETFTYSVSHDLKAPLRGIDGYSRLLLTDHVERLDDEGRTFVQNIRQATHHMGALIDDLLAYSRLERRDLAIAPLPLADTVEAVLVGFRQDLGAAGVQLQVQIETDLRVRADGMGLAQALRNLVDNAIKFSRASAPPRITIVARRTEAGVALTVQDNGCGFDMKFHERIFSIFQRLHRAEDYPGTGIGLAIVRKAVDRMGGRVWAESPREQGAVFTIELPEAT